MGEGSWLREARCHADKGPDEDMGPPHSAVSGIKQGSVYGAPRVWLEGPSSLTWGRAGLELELGFREHGSQAGPVQQLWAGRPVAQRETGRDAAAWTWFRHGASG